MARGRFIEDILGEMSSRLSESNRSIIQVFFFIIDRWSICTDEDLEMMKRSYHILI